MKTCPVCKAQCFDDMSICYGCMYHFPENAQQEKSPQETERDQEEAEEQFPEEPPAAVIDQVEAFEPDPPEQTVQDKENLVANQDNKACDEEGRCVAEAHGVNNEESPQTIVVPFEECGLEISIVVRPIGKGA